LGLDQFIEKANKIHNRKYDYSKVDYINGHSKVTIICPEHGEFSQRPNPHLKGGCIECSGLKHKTTEEFVQKAIKVHGDKYDYSKSVYKNNHSKVTIICQKHGYFEQTPHGHLAKQGCPKCSVERIANALRLSQKEFIKRASNIHQGKYDYSKTVYVRNIEKITIICPHHGEFQQLAGSHLSGNGCWKCVVTYPLSKEQFIQVAIEKNRLI